MSCNKNNTGFAKHGAQFVFLWKSCAYWLSFFACGAVDRGIGRDVKNPHKLEAYCV